MEWHPLGSAPLAERRGAKAVESLTSAFRQLQTFRDRR